MPTSIYHITHIDNLAQIIRANGLRCDAERLRQGFDSVGIAHDSLKSRRARKTVAVAGGGTLADYVPFYFANRSPMLFSIHTGNVAGYTDGQAEVIYLVSTLKRVAEGDRSWCFTDGHAVDAVTEFYDSVRDLGNVDWTIIRHWSWKNTDADPDRKRRKQAECLVHSSFPWAWVQSFAVINRKVGTRVSRILEKETTAHRPNVHIERKWYY